MTRDREGAHQCNRPGDRQHQGEARGLDAHLPDEALALELSSRSEDFREGLKAFTEKRDPDFRGR